MLLRVKRIGIKFWYLWVIIFLLLIVVIVQKSLPAKVSDPFSTFDGTVSVRFGSVCCGPPSGTFLTDLVNSFQSKYKVDIPSRRFSCGPEGEYYMSYKISILDPNTKSKFVSDLSAAIAQQGNYLISHEFNFPVNKNCPQSFPKPSTKK